MFSTKGFNHILHFLSIFNKLTPLSSELDDVIQLWHITALFNKLTPVTWAAITYCLHFQVPLWAAHTFGQLKLLPAARGSWVGIPAWGSVPGTGTQEIWCLHGLEQVLTPIKAIVFITEVWCSCKRSEAKVVSVTGWMVCSNDPFAEKDLQKQK